MTEMADPEPGGAVDRAVIDRYREMAGDGFVSLLIKQYFDEAANLIDTILVATNEERSIDVASAAHQLKGSSATIGAIEMAAICAELEAQIRAGDRADAAQLSGALEGKYQSARHELQRLSCAEVAELD